MCLLSYVLCIFRHEKSDVCVWGYILTKKTCKVIKQQTLKVKLTKFITSISIIIKLNFNYGYQPFSEKQKPKKTSVCFSFLVNHV